MTTSSADAIPRGVDFLFSLNRINVAVSRAQVLSLVFASPAPARRSLCEYYGMRLVNSCVRSKNMAGTAAAPVIDLRACQLLSPRPPTFLD